jgi:ATP synthase protein I
MPKPPSDAEAFARLDQRVDALQARTTRKRVETSYEASGAGYKLVAELVSGILGGLGLGWLVDKVVGWTSPFGLIIGVLGGTAASVVLVVMTASRMSDQAHKDAPGRPVPIDEKDDV